MDKQVFIEIAYILSAVLFMFGLKKMAHPRTAVRGNLYGILGMIVAVAATMFSDEIAQSPWIVGHFWRRCDGSLARLHDPDDCHAPAGGRL